MARPPNVLLAFAAVTLLSSGGAVSTVDKFEPVRQYPTDLLPKGDVTAKRFLRSIDSREMTDEDRQEERGGGWKIPLLGSAEKKASKEADKAAKAAAKDRETIQKHLDLFQSSALRGDPASDIGEFFRRWGYRKKERSDMERLYRVYRADPKAYH